MRYENTECVLCKKIFTADDDVVTCPECGSPHHRECWNINGRCANADKHGDGFVWKNPLNVEKPSALKGKSLRAQQLHFEEGMQGKNGERFAACPRCGHYNFENEVMCQKCRLMLVDLPELVSKESGVNINRDGKNQNDVEKPDLDGIDPHKLSHEDFLKFMQASSLDEIEYKEREREYLNKYLHLRDDAEYDGGITVREYAEYLGNTKARVYIRKIVASERVGKSFCLTIPALLFGPVWYFYKKMFKEGFLYLAGILILSLVVGFCSLTQPAKDMYAQIAIYYSQVESGEISVDEYYELYNEAAREYSAVELDKTDRIKENIGIIASSSIFALHVTMSFAALFFYKKKIKRDILSVRKKYADSDEYYGEVQEKGTPSVASAIFGVALAVAACSAGTFVSVIYMMSLII